MSSAALSRSPDSRRSARSSVLARREYERFLEDMEIESALTAGPGAFDLGDLADPPTLEPFADMLDEHGSLLSEPLPGELELDDVLSGALASFSVADLDWVMKMAAEMSGEKARIGSASGDSIANPLAAAAMALPEEAIELPLVGGDIGA